MFILAISPGEGFDEARWRFVLASGINALMIREKSADARTLLEITRRVQALARELAPECQIWVNGRLDVALAVGCGLHAPEAYPDVPPGLVSLSRPLHDLASFASRSAAQQLIISPVFETPAKGPALGPAKLHEWLDELPSFPGRILALGGITPENCGKLQHPRLAGVAMIRSLWHATDPGDVVSRLRSARD